MPRWVSILLATLLGIVIGLLYGWVIDPVQFTDITPDALRIDYKTDYVLMVAEAYQTEQKEEVAARRLAILGSQSPALLVGGPYFKNCLLPCKPGNQSPGQLYREPNPHPMGMVGRCSVGVWHWVGIRLAPLPGTVR